MEERKITLKCACCEETLQVALHPGLPVQLDGTVAEMIAGDLLPALGWQVFINTVDLRVEMLCSQPCVLKIQKDMAEKRSLRDSVGGGVKTIIMPGSGGH